MPCGLCGLPCLGTLRRWLGCNSCKDKCDGCRELHRTCKACVVRQKDAVRDPTWPLSWPPGLTAIPTKFRLSPLPPPQDQKGISACAVNACAAALNYLYACRGVSGFQASRMFLYYNTRRYIMKLPDVAVDTGCNLRDVCAAASAFGVCDEAEWRYCRKLLGTQPPSAQYAKAARMPRCKHHAVVQSLHHILSCLLNNQPIVMGLSLFSNIKKAHAEGVLDMPTPQDTVLGSHAVMLCGYNLAHHRFIVQNCWGDGWANRGCFEMPFDYVLNAALCWDLWTLLLTGH